MYPNLQWGADAPIYFLNNTPMKLKWTACNQWRSTHSVWKSFRDHRCHMRSYSVPALLLMAFEFGSYFIATCQFCDLCVNSSGIILWQPFTSTFEFTPWPASGEWPEYRREARGNLHGTGCWWGTTWHWSQAVAVQWLSKTAQDQQTSTKQSIWW